MPLRLQHLKTLFTRETGILAVLVQVKKRFRQTSILRGIPFGQLGYLDAELVA